MTCAEVRSAARRRFCPADCEQRGGPPSAGRCLRLVAVIERARALREAREDPHPCSLPMPKRESMPRQRSVGASAAYVDGCGRVSALAGEE